MNGEKARLVWRDPCIGEIPKEPKEQREYLAPSRIAGCALWEDFRGQLTDRYREAFEVVREFTGHRQFCPWRFAFVNVFVACPRCVHAKEEA